MLACVLSCPPVRLPAGVSDPWSSGVQPTGKVEGGATRIPLVVNVTRSGGVGVRAVLGNRSLLTAGQRTDLPSAAAGVQQALLRLQLLELGSDLVKPYVSV